MPTSPGSVNRTRTGTTPPAQPPGLIRRERILGQLSSAQQPALVVVLVAPAGYGKTTVLSQWAARNPPSFAWVAIDEEDNDPVELVRHIVSSLARIEPAHDPVLASLRSRRAPPQAVLVPGLLTWLGRHASDRVLVLDDLQRLHNPVSLDVVGTIVSQLPPGWRLAIASRTRPELHVTPLRRQGRYLELGPQQLTFSLPEARTLLEVAGIANVTEQRLRALVRRTEAWPAGLHLAVLSMLAGRDQAAATRVSGDDGRLAGYFREEVLNPEGDTEVARFLLRTSVLARMSADLCDAVLATTDSAAQLAEAVRRNLFVVPQDRRGQWYRYHHLFADFLRSELRRREPEIEAELHRRAAIWLSGHGLVPEAIPHALAAGDLSTAARLTTMCAQVMVNTGRIGAVRRWIEVLGTEGFAAYPPLAITATWVWALDGQTAKAQRSLRAAEKAQFDGTPADGSASLESGIRMARVAMARGGLEQMLLDSRRAVELELPGSAWHPVAMWLLGSAELLGDDRDQAAKAFQRSAFLGREGQRTAATLALAQLSLLAAEAGDWPAAAVHAGEAQKLVRAGRPQDRLTGMMSHLASAKVALYQGDREAAQLSVSNAARLYNAHPAATFPWLTAQTAIDLGRILLDLGDVPGARVKAGEARVHLARLAAPGSLADQLRQLTGDVDHRHGSRGQADALTLTQAQVQVLHLLGTHLTLADIARELGISRNTVKTHVAAVYRKLQASSRADAVRRGRRLGLLSS